MIKESVSVRWSGGSPEISNKQFLCLLLRNVTEHNQYRGLVWGFFSEIGTEKYLILHFYILHLWQNKERWYEKKHLKKDRKKFRSSTWNPLFCLTSGL